ncbi:ABC transporter permease [Alkalicoccus halolimnae]|uniref:ABC transporter permease n=1 Tax=Alkalicoccus halolimnae TaxID=1667239 RepID=A0A5C7F3B2_9BACI|nr:ABC transporter permease [Alkalicoccus halolimnae]TXF85141.1 ABC transporter permease [Alkalicoccus halolimnae]
MLAYTIRRILMLIPVLIGMSLITFSIIHLIPGNPAQTILGEQATPQAIAQLEEQLGINEPYLVQYFDYIGGLLQGDLGQSLRTNADISNEIWPFLAATIELTIFAMVFAVIVGVNAGIISAWKQNSLFDYGAMLVALIGVSMPIFWLGLMQQWIFAQELGWLPAFGRGNPRDPVETTTHFYLLDTLLSGRMDQFWTSFRHLILPGVALGTIPMAIIARMTRSSMLEVLRSDYIRTVEAKGIPKLSVVYRHGFKNAVIPVLTIVGLQTGTLLGGAILTETIFSWPGVGRYVFDGIGNRDYPVIQSGILIIATMFVFINLIVDLLYSYIDPRIKY